MAKKLKVAGTFSGDTSGEVRSAFVASDTPPENTDVLWVDTSDDTGEHAEITDAQMQEIAERAAGMVDVPSGGGEQWELISEGTIAEEVASVEINQDINGEPFNLSKCYLSFVVEPCEVVASNAQYMYTVLNGKAVLPNSSSDASKTRYYQCVAMRIGKAVVCAHVASNTMANHTWTVANHYPDHVSNCWSVDEKITRVKLLPGNQSPGLFIGINSKYELYGVRA